MAFGKNNASPNHSRMNTRQMMKRGAMRPPKGGGGGNASWHNKYAPPLKGPADIVRLLPGNYPTPRIDMQRRDYCYDDTGHIITDPFPFYKVVEYFHGVKHRSCIGSEGPLGIFKGKGDPCIASDWFWWEWRQRNKYKSKSPNAMRRSDRFIMSVLVQAPFYKVPQTDKEGNQRINTATAEPYYEWVKGARKGNDAYAAAGYERKEGHVMHWPMGYAHYAVLDNHGEQLSKGCTSCGGTDTIEDVALACQSCGETIVMMDNTALSEEEIAKLKDEEVRCPNCGVFGYLEDIIRCTGCNRANPATIFDYDLRVKRVETTSSDGGSQTALQIMGALGPRPISDEFGEDLRKPLDLPKIYSPTSIDTQLDLFGALPADDEGPPNEEEEQPARKPVRTGSKPYR
jgi:hypothetical protein